MQIEAIPGKWNHTSWRGRKNCTFRVNLQMAQINAIGSDAIIGMDYREL